MSRNYGIPHRQLVLRPERSRQRLLAVLRDTLYLIAGLLLLLAVYGWVGAMDAQAKAEVQLAHCLSGGTFSVNGHDALKCQGVIYEKGN